MTDSPPIRLTIDEVRVNLGNSYFPTNRICDVLVQLYDTMRENERLLKHLNGADFQFREGYSGYAKVEIEMALKPYKDSND